MTAHTVDSAPEGSRDTLKKLEAQFGKVLNIHGAMAHSPAVLETYVAIRSSSVPHDEHVCGGDVRRRAVA